LRIEICGNIASGKTTLAHLLSQVGFDGVFEQFQSNPFWRDFYKDQANYSFETELSFHLQHYHDIKINAEADKKLVCDYSLFLDRAYADVTLAGNKRKIFSSVADEVESELGVPEIIVYLHCPNEILLSRIIERGRSVEAGITIEYLQQLSKSIAARMDMISKFTSVINIDSNKINFVDTKEGETEVLEALKL